jgi:hypothetical protein
MRSRASSRPFDSAQGERDFPFAVVVSTNSRFVVVVNANSVPVKEQAP